MATQTEGFLWAYRFVGGAPKSMPRKPLPPKLREQDNWLWAHFALSDQRARRFLQGFEDIPKEARALLVDEDRSPCMMFAEGWAFGVLPDFEMEFDGKYVRVGRLRYAFDDSRLITVRLHPMQVIHEIQLSLESGATLPSPLDAFMALSKRYCEVAEDQLDELTRLIDHIEDRVLGEEENLERLELGPVRRDLSKRHRELSWLRSAYHRTLNRQGQSQAHPMIALLPQLLVQTEDIDHALTALQDRARLVHEEIDTKINSATNRTLHTLTVMTALMMPPTLVVGAFGMNLKGIAFAEDPAGFAIVSILCAITIFGAYVLLRQMRIIR